MLCLRTLLLLCCSVALATAVLVQGQIRRSDGNKDQINTDKTKDNDNAHGNNHFRQQLELLPEESLHAALHKGLDPKFKDGVFEGDRAAIETVRARDPPLAEKLIELAKHELVKRQNDSTPTASQTPGGGNREEPSSSDEEPSPPSTPSSVPRTPVSSNSPTPPTRQTPSRTSAAASPPSRSPPSRSPTTPSPSPPPPAQPTPDDPPSRRPPLPAPGAGNADDNNGGTDDPEPANDVANPDDDVEEDRPVPGSPNPPDSEPEDSSPSRDDRPQSPPDPPPIIVPVDIDDTDDDGEAVVIRTSAVVAASVNAIVTRTTTNADGEQVEEATSVPGIEVTETNDDGDEVVVTSPAQLFTPAPRPDPAEEIDVTVTGEDGEEITLSDVTPGKVLTATDARGSTLITTYTPKALLISSLVLQTTTLPDGSLSTITKLEIINPTSAAGDEDNNDVEDDLPEPELQSAAAGKLHGLVDVFGLAGGALLGLWFAL